MSDLLVVVSNSVRNKSVCREKSNKIQRLADVQILTR